MRFLILSLFSFSFSGTVALAVVPLTQCRTSVTSGQQPLLQAVYDQFTKTRAEKFNDTQDICPVQFSMKPMENPPELSCQIVDDGKVTQQKSMVATMDFRDAKGELYTVDYKVCQGEDPSVFSVKNKLSGKHIDEVNFHFENFTIPKIDDAQNNDNNCDVNHRVDQTVCVPTPGFAVFGWSTPQVVAHSSHSSLIGVTAIPDKPNCVNVAFYLIGGGYQANVSGQKVGCNESGWYKYTIDLRAVSTGAKP